MKGTEYRCKQGHVQDFFPIGAWGIMVRLLGGWGGSKTAYQLPQATETSRQSVETSLCFSDPAPGLAAVLSGGEGTGERLHQVG